MFISQLDPRTPYRAEMPVLGQHMREIKQALHDTLKSGDNALLLRAVFGVYNEDSEQFDLSHQIPLNNELVQLLLNHDHKPVVLKQPDDTLITVNNTDAVSAYECHEYRASTGELDCLTRTDITGSAETITTRSMAHIFLSDHDVIDWNQGSIQSISSWWNINDLSTLVFVDPPGPCFLQLYCAAYQPTSESDRSRMHIPGTWSQGQGGVVDLEEMGLDIHFDGANYFVNRNDTFGADRGYNRVINGVGDYSATWWTYSSGVNSGWRFYLDFFGKKVSQKMPFVEGAQYEVTADVLHHDGQVEVSLSGGPAVVLAETMLLTAGADQTGAAYVGLLFEYTSGSGSAWFNNITCRQVL